MFVLGRFLLMENLTDIYIWQQLLNTKQSKFIEGLVLIHGQKEYLRDESGRTAIPSEDTYAVEENHVLSWILWSWEVISATNRSNKDIDDIQLLNKLGPKKVIFTVTIFNVSGYI